jgi:hypothetical protein
MMSIESLKARLEEHDRQRMRYGYSDETAPQIWERDLRALLKVAEAAAALAEDRTTKEWLPLLVALAELEAQE